MIVINKIINFLLRTQSVTMPSGEERLSKMNNKQKLVNEDNYVPVHAIGGYLSQLRLKQKLEKENKE